METPVLRYTQLFLLKSVAFFYYVVYYIVLYRPQAYQGPQGPEGRRGQDGQRVTKLFLYLLRNPSWEVYTITVVILDFYILYDFHS